MFWDVPKKIFSGLAMTAMAVTLAATVWMPFVPYVPAPHEMVLFEYRHNPGGPKPEVMYTAWEFSPFSMVFFAPKTPAWNVRQIVVAPAKQIDDAPHESAGIAISTAPVTSASAQVHVAELVSVPLWPYSRDLKFPPAELQYEVVSYTPSPVEPALQSYS